MIDAMHGNSQLYLYKHIDTYDARLMSITRFYLAR